MDLTKTDIKHYNNFERFLNFTPTWAFGKLINLANKRISLFTGNQSMKTSSIAYQYVFRILGWHPIPKKNVLYFECTMRTKDNPSPHGYYEVQETEKIRLRGYEKGTWNVLTRPKDNICTFCGAKIRIHKRKSKIFRFAAESLPTDKNTTGTDGQSTEIRNSVYPEFKKWLPDFLIRRDPKTGKRRDITVRNPAISICDPWDGERFGDLEYNGTDIVVEFVSYNQSTQAGAGVQRMSCVSEGQRVLMADGVWREIEKIKAGDELICETLGGFDNRQRTNIVKSTKNMGKKDVLRFKCQKGIEFEVTGDHLVMVPGRGKSKYIKADSFTVGDGVRCRTSKIVGNNEVPLWQVILTAMLLGDGTITEKQKCPKFTCKNKQLIKDVERVLPEGIYLREQLFKNGHSPDYFISDKTPRRNRIKEFLAEHGAWGCVAGNKFVPDIIFKQSDNSIRKFLSFIFACDGWAYGHGLGYCSTSKRLAQDIMFLLRRLEIRSTINKKIFANGWADQYHVSICQAQDVLRFCDLIGIAGKSEAVKKARAEAERRMESSVKRSSFAGERNDSRKVPQRVKIKSIKNIGTKSVYDISMAIGGWDERDKNGKKKQRIMARSPRDNFLIQGGVVVHNCWMDEEAPKDFDEEQGPRLIAEDGDKLDTLTPANRMTWTFDDIYENANLYVRTQAVCDFLGKERPTPRIEQTGSDMDIAVIQAATDDNPTLSKEAIEAEFNIHDPDGVIIPTRRYGIFKQATGRIFKDFNPNIHVINPKKYHISRDVLAEWVLARTEDFHTKTPLAILWVALSPQNEAFVWQEWSPSPDKWVTDKVCVEIAERSGRMSFVCNLIDPLANSSNSNTGKTTVEEMNKKFYELKHDGVCTGGYWEPYNTKGNVGRDDITTRLQNSAKVGQPFNNIVLLNGIKKQLPTLWIFNECHEMARSLKHWRRESWANSRQLVTKEQKETPAQRFSHCCTALEGIFKDKRFRPRTRGTQRHREVPSYFKAGAR